MLLHSASAPRQPLVKVSDRLAAMQQAVAEAKQFAVAVVFVVVALLLLLAATNGDGEPNMKKVGASSNRAPAYPKRIAPRLIDLVVSCVSLTKRIHENLMAGFCGCVQVRCDPLVLFNEIGGHED